MRWVPIQGGGPKVTYQPDVIYNCPCDDAAAWASASGAASTRTNDTDNYLCGSTNMQSVKITKTGGTSVEVNNDLSLGGSQDVRTSGGAAPWLLIRLYIHEGSGASSYAQIARFILRFQSGGAWTDFYSATVWGSIRRPGWVTIIATPKVTSTGVPSWATISLIRFRFETAAAADVGQAVTIDQIAFIEPFIETPSYAFTFDDALDEQYESAAYLASKGLKGTFYVIPSRIGTAGYLTLEQLHRMKEAGHLIANHSWDHGYWVTDSMSVEQAANEIVLAGDWLCQNGFGDGARIFAVPGGSYECNDNAYIRGLLGSYCDSMRFTSEHGVSNEVRVTQSRSDCIFTHAFDSDAAQVLTDLLAYGGCVVTGFHGTAGLAFANFKALVDTVAAQHQAGTIRVVTVKEILEQGL